MASIQQVPMTTPSPNTEQPDPGEADDEVSRDNFRPERSDDSSAPTHDIDHPKATFPTPLLNSSAGTPSPSPGRLPKSLRPALNAVLWTGLFVGTAITSALIGAGAALKVPLPEFIAAKPSQPLTMGDLWKSGFRYQVTRPVNVLVMGIDEVLDVSDNSEAIFTGRTDTLLLVRVDPQDGILNVMSIPRDTRVQIPGYGMAKINQANVEGGSELVAQTIGYNLGNIQIDRYLRVNTTAFREIVDLIGGVEVYVPQRMEYTDQTQGLYIDLYPGWQTLDGDQAEQFARFRQADGDVGRVQRQQTLLKALRERLTSPTVIPKLPQAIRVVQRYIDTNLTLEEMLALANFGLAIEPDDLNMVMLPGRFSGAAEYNASYWLPDWEASANILQSFFQTSAVGVYADNNQSRYIADLNIAVQNATDDPTLGESVASYLRENGFNRVYVTADWPAVSQRTEIIAQKGDLDSARMVESVLGTGHVLSESTGDLNSDLTIRVGQDWAEHLSQDNAFDTSEPGALEPGALELESRP